MQVLVDGEAERLHDRILEKIRSGPPAGPAAPPDGGSFADWLQYRFLAPLVRDAVAAPAYGKSATLIGAGTIGAGLGSSALASFSDDVATTAVAVLGIVVGLLGAITQIWRPAQRSVTRYQAAFSLRREGWDFLQDRGRYERLKPEHRLAAFIDEVNRIHRAVEQVDEATSPSQTTG
jgi:hypothetical protein